MAPGKLNQRLKPAASWLSFDPHPGHRRPAAHQLLGAPHAGADLGPDPRVGQPAPWDDDFGPPGGGGERRFWCLLGSFLFFFGGEVFLAECFFGFLPRKNGLNQRLGRRHCLFCVCLPGGRFLRGVPWKRRRAKVSFRSVLDGNRWVPLVYGLPSKRALLLGDVVRNEPNNHKCAFDQFWLGQ